MADAKKVIRLNYKAYMADADRLYDTTYEQDAKDAGIYNEKVKYQPMAYIVGSKKLFPALDKAISEAKVGEEFTVEIPAEEGAGARNPKLVETHSVKEFYRQEINPYPGLTVSLGNKTGVVLSVGAGRVKVDFNNALAGHDLKYVMTIAEEITDDAEKAKAIIEADFAAADDFKFEFPGDKVVVTLPEITKFHQEWPVARFRVVSDLRETFGVDTVEFVEIWSAAKKE
ncbi:MAG: FKBP-type peptidyl-prolyl cis-trans isomerase [Candidatus Methanomethylophilus sp.]|jgi:FKBP-type peptidyl-prolyl cis-trans isomerase SlyD|nr:FKBP-type peptidyl-prolyl cis-trans isomerase [Methanomethylophilus sp.]MBQ5483030.1 FKBP-type peptidyl-prolyl cis-trans isomerase [Methanomethylophilus sp.]